jgi:acetyl esterase/lipase
MSRLVFLRHLVRHTPRVAFSRVRRGPSRPSWSFGFELFTTALRETSHDIAKLDWPAQRVAFDALADLHAPALKRVARADTVLGGVPTSLFVPRHLGAPGSPSSDTTLLYLHGGAYIFGSMRTHGELIARLALATPARTLAPTYRLAPEHPFPAAIDDVVAVYRALLESGVDPRRLVIAGDSAGGGLTMALLLRLRAAGHPLPAGAALICPWVDLSAEGGSLTRNAPFDWGDEAIGRRWTRTYLAGQDPRDPLASPVFADLRGLPPLLVQVGGAELLRDQGTALAERAKEAGVDARFKIEPDMVHNWHTFAGLFSHCARSIDDVGAFVRSVVA